MPSFLCLPEELLLLIFSYLDTPALGRVGRVCRRLYHVTSRDAVWRRLAKKCINTGFTLQGTDTAHGIPVKQRLEVSQNWKRGRCLQETPLKWKRNLMPWMQLEDEVLYLSQAEHIRSYQLRPENNALNHRPVSVFSGHREDVCRFVLANSHVVSGGGDGKISLHKMHSTISVQFAAHKQDVNCIDCRGSVIVSGSRDRTAKVWSLSPGRLGQCLHTIQTDDRVWSVAISPLLSEATVRRLLQSCRSRGFY